MENLHGDGKKIEMHILPYKDLAQMPKPNGAPTPEHLKMGYTCTFHSASSTPTTFRKEKLCHFWFLYNRKMFKITLDRVLVALSQVCYGVLGYQEKKAYK